MKGFRVLLADDHHLVRAGIRALVEDIDGATVVGEAGDGREAVALAVKHHPDIAILDINMRELNGIDAAARIATEARGVRVLMLSMHTTEDFVRRALRAGASGYLVKDSAPLELQMAIEALLRGETFLSSRVSKGLVARMLGDSPGPAETSLDALTPRQREILQLIAEGKSTKEIAFTLKVSVKTVETHRGALMERLGIHDVAGLVLYAVRHKLVEVDNPTGS